MLVRIKQVFFFAFLFYFIFIIGICFLAGRVIILLLSTSLPFQQHGRVGRFLTSIRTLEKWLRLTTVRFS